MKYLIMYCFLAAICFGCESEKVAKHETAHDRDIRIQRVKEPAIASLKQRYGVSEVWDSIRFLYTIGYQNAIKNANHLITGGKLMDVYEKDTILYARISCGVYPTFTFELKVIGDIQKRSLLDLVEERNNQGDFSPSEFVVVVKIDRINRLKFEVYADRGYGDELAIVEIENPDNFIGEGSVVDLVVVK